VAGLNVLSIFGVSREVLLIFAVISRRLRSRVIYDMSRKYYKLSSRTVL
jgi:hypothetical protein